MKNCKECVFGIHYGFDKGGMLTIQMCHARDMSDKELAEMILHKEDCEMYAEGHELYKRYKSGEFDSLSASQKHIIDRKDFSEQPTAICEHPCYRGDGKYCYCRLNCTAKTELNGSGKMLKEERELLGKAIARGISMKNEEENNDT